MTDKPADPNHQLLVGDRPQAQLNWHDAGLVKETLQQHHRCTKAPESRKIPKLPPWATYFPQHTKRRI